MSTIKKLKPLVSDITPTIAEIEQYFSDIRTGETEPELLFWETSHYKVHRWVDAICTQTNKKREELIALVKSTSTTAA